MKNVRRILYILMLVSMTFLLISCKKQVKHKWIEVGSDPNPPKIAPGVHPERGSISDAVPIVSAPVIVPTGRDSDGRVKYVKYLYDMETLSAEGIDEAMKELGLITDSSLFCNLLIEDIDTDSDSISAGPGASENAKLTKKGTVRYVVLDSDLVNAEDVSSDDIQEGVITMDDVKECIASTFEENYQLVSCDIEMVTMDEYKRLHGTTE